MNHSQLCMPCAQGDPGTSPHQADASPAVATITITYAGRPRHTNRPVCSTHLMRARIMRSRHPRMALQVRIGRA